MFETSVVRPQAHSVNRYRFLTLSLAVHSCAIAAVITATIANTRLPIEAPRQMEMPVFMPVISLPPALGTPNAQPKPAAPPAARIPAPAPAAVTAPPTIPEQAPAQSTEPAAAASGTGTGQSAGAPEGMPGGIGTDTAGAGTGAAQEAPLPVGGDVKAPVVIHRVLPQYPRSAMMARVGGWVIVECIIDKSGRIRDARVVKSSFGAFEQPALEAVQQWVFTPGTLGGRAVDTIFDLTVTFQIH